MPAVVPAVEGFLKEETRAWADRNGVDVSWLERDTDAYWRFLSREWGLAGDLLVVEHDMVPAPGVTESMAACRRPWCSSPFRIENGTWLPDGLGCIRLAARLKERHPDLMGRLGEMTGDGLPPKDWRRLDVRLSQLLRGLGYRPHLHRRSVHLHDYSRLRRSLTSSPPWLARSPGGVPFGVQPARRATRHSPHPQQSGQALYLHAEHQCGSHPSASGGEQNMHSPPQHQQGFG